MGSFSGRKRWMGSWVGPFLLMTVSVKNVAAVPAVAFPEYDEVRGTAVDFPGGYAYLWTAPSGATPAALLKLNLSNLASEGALLFGAGDQVTFCVIDSLRKYAYFGTETSPGKIVRVRLSDFTMAGTLTLNLGQNKIVSGVIDRNNAFAYFGTDTSPGQIVKVNLSTFQSVGVVVLGNQQGNVRPAVIDKEGTYAYFGTYGDDSLSKVIQLDLSHFQVNQSLTLDPEDGRLSSGFLDSSDGKLYFGANGGRRLIEINLPGFTRQWHTDLIVGDELKALPLLNSARFKYFLTKYDIVGKFVKLNLADVKKVDEVNLDLGKSGLPTGILDLTAGLAYFTMDPRLGHARQIKIKDFSQWSLGSDLFHLPDPSGAMVVAGWTSGTGNANLSLVATAQTPPPAGLTGLAMNTTYFLSIKARDGGGRTIALHLGNAITFASQPGFRIEERMANTVKFTIDPNGNPEGTAYEVEKELDGGGYQWVLTTTSLTPSLTGLTRGGDLNFRVRAMNHYSHYTGYSSAVNVLVLPPEPSQGEFTLVAHNRVELSWTPAKGAKTYTLLASQHEDDLERDVKTSPTESPSGTVTELVPNTKYFLFLKASNDGGDSGYTSLGSTITLAAKPGAVLGKTETSSVSLTIHPNGNPAGTEYEVESRSADGALIQKVKTTSLTLAIVGLNPGTHYQFQVRAINQEGIATDYSSPVIGETVKPAITTVDAVRSYPVPFRPGHGHSSITFDQMPADSTIRVYSLTGTLVKEIHAGAEQVSWDVKNDSAEDVASGVYFVRVSGSGGDKTFKIAVQR